MKTTAFITWALLASCLAFGVGSAASWLLGRPASASGDGSGVSDPLLPDLVAVTLEAAPEGESEATRVVFVGKHEVTIAGWEQCVDAGACDHRPRQRRYQGADHPVTGVSVPSGDKRHATAPRPFFATSVRSFSEAPRGRFSPRSHWLTRPVVTLR